MQPKMKVMRSSKPRPPERKEEKKKREEANKSSLKLVPAVSREKKGAVPRSIVTREFCSEAIIGGDIIWKQNKREEERARPRVAKKGTSKVDVSGGRVRYQVTRRAYKWMEGKKGGRDETRKNLPHPC